MFRTTFRIALATLVIGGLACGGDDTNEPSKPSYLGRIFFIAGPTGGGSDMDIYSIRPDGTSLLNHTNHPAYYSSLAPSPDGETIMFYRAASDADSGDVFALDASGSLARQITRNAFRERGLSWNPNSDLVTVIRENDLYTMNRDGSNAVLIADSAYSATWSPNGDFIVYAKYSGGPTGIDLWRITPQGTDGVPLVAATGDDRNPFYNSNGTAVYFTNQSVDGLQLRRQNLSPASTDTLTDRSVFDADIGTVSPRGDTVAFTYATSGLKSSIYLRLPGGGLVPLTNFGDTTAYAPAWAGSPR